MPHHIVMLPSYQKAARFSLVENILTLKCFFVKVTLFVLTLHRTSQITWLCFISNKQETISISMHLVNVVQSVSNFQLSVTPWTTEGQASLFFTISWSLLKLMFIFRNQILHFLILTSIPLHGLLKCLLCPCTSAVLEVRLKDGAHNCEGKVEVKRQGEWGTVNDDNWSMEEAQVVCREPKCGAATDTPRGAYFGSGIGPIWFQYIYCNGTESMLTQCSYPPLKDHHPEGLSHDGDAGAVCSGKSCMVWEGISNRKSLSLFLGIT